MDGTGLEGDQEAGPIGGAGLDEGQEETGLKSGVCQDERCPEVHQCRLEQPGGHVRRTTRWAEPLWRTGRMTIRHMEPLCRMTRRQ